MVACYDASFNLANSSASVPTLAIGTKCLIYRRSDFSPLAAELQRPVGLPPCYLANIPTGRQSRGPRHNGGNVKVQAGYLRRGLCSGMLRALKGECVNGDAAASTGQKIVWYWRRFRRMSAGEVLHRIKSGLQTAFERAGIGSLHFVPAADLTPKGSRWINRPGGVIDHKWLLEEARRFVDGKLSIFALQDVSIGIHPQWNRDPLTGTMAPLNFGKALDYRDTGIVGDIKYLWEPNRHLHLVTLAQAYAISKEPEYIETIERHLRGWIQQCPYLRGPNWTSSLELSIRLISWSAVWQLVGGASSDLFLGDSGDDLKRMWVESVYRHCHLINGHWSEYSSANNHLIGEASGLFVASLTWPFWPESERWKRKAYGILATEALSQNAIDGVNREQAVSYQQFVLDFLIIAGLAGRDGGTDFSTDYWTRIEAMLGYLASIMDVKGNVPMIGDADDGYVVRLSHEPGFCPYRSLLATGALLFERSDFARKAGRLDDKTRWLLGWRAQHPQSPESPEELERSFTKLRDQPGPSQPRRAFQEGGYYLLGNCFEVDREIRLLVDAGPLGYLSIAAHGHADALALWLSIGGQELLVDPGTYAYHTRESWRSYFRGTAAHNTVRVDGVDQSVPGGNFMWIHHAKARCLEWSPGAATDRLVAQHEGYKRLRDPVIHRREIVLDKAAKSLRVLDTLVCNGPHQVERFWHLAEDCVVRSEGKDIRIAKGVVQLWIRNLGTVPMNVQCVQGREDPPLGWISRRFDVKVPTTTVEVTDQIVGTTTLETEITWQRADDPDISSRGALSEN